MPLNAINWDKLGGTAGALCAVHCVLTGVAMGVLSASGLQFFAERWVEWTFFSIAIFAGVLAVRSGIRRHGQWGWSLVLIAGIGCLIAKQMMFSHAGGHDHSHHGHDHGHDHAHGHPAGELWLSVLGGMGIVIFHVVNGWLSHRKACACPACAPTSAVIDDVRAAIAEPTIAPR
jgi:hypothetical protein